MSGSKHLIKCPDLSLATNLESLILEDCISLIEIPSSNYLKSLTRLCLCRCSNFKTFPEISFNIKWLYLNGTAIEELPSSIGEFTELERLDLEECSRLKNLPSSIWRLKSLGALNLSGCSKLGGFPEEVETLEVLRKLKGKTTTEREVLSFIVNLNNINRFPIEILKDQELKMGMCNLVRLDLTGCGGIMALPDSLGYLSSLQLSLASRNNFEKIPTTIINLTNLFYLELSHCKRLRFLPKLPRNLKRIQAQCCTSLETLLDISTLLENNGLELNLMNCFKFDSNTFRGVVESDLQKFSLWTCMR